MHLVSWQGYEPRKRKEAVRLVLSFASNWPSGKSANRLWRLGLVLPYRRPQNDQRFCASTAQYALYNRIPGFVLMHLPN